MSARSGPRSAGGAQRPILLLVDDDPLIVDSLSFVLSERFDVRPASTRSAARKALREAYTPSSAPGARPIPPAPVIALVDLGLPPAPHAPDEGFALVSEIVEAWPDVRVLVLSGQTDNANIKHALTLGAVDFIPKPCDADLLLARLEHQLFIAEADRESGWGEQAATSELLGTSPAIQSLVAEIARYAPSPFPVLIEGESGTGKELVAERLHRLSDRSGEPFVTLNCAAFSGELLEAQLFGHARGAYTGAGAARGGFFEEAGAGTLFLDEIGELPLPLQPKLLRVLENGEYYRLGETRPRFARARVIAATNRSLLQDVREQRFRADLYHRLSVLTLRAPPLRERGEDRIVLLHHFRQQYAVGGRSFELDEEALERWRSYTFPGNVRELKNIVIRLNAKYPGQLVGLHALEAELDEQAELDGETLRQIADGAFRLDETLDLWERRYIDAALRLSRGNLSEAARLLGVNRTTLYGKIQRLRSSAPRRTP